MKRFTGALAGLAMMTTMMLVTTADAQPAPATPQDPAVLYFASRVAPYYPDSVFRVTTDATHRTPSGSYRRLVVDRECAAEFLSSGISFLVDQVTETAWVGPAATLPAQPAADKRGLRPYVEELLVPALERNLGTRVSVSWDTPGRRAGALIPFILEMSTGFGTYSKPAAVTADGQFVVIGAPMPWGEDPVAHRRQLLAGSDAVMWDHPAGNGVAIVEFSDFQCPGCKAKWPVIEALLAKHPKRLRHGMVNDPLTSIHPWAFRAAAAAWCVSQQDPTKVIGLKETFYDLQKDMQVSLVEPTAKDFVAGAGLDEGAFAACYLKPPSVAGVHRQLELTAAVDVIATPTYFVDGWMVQVPDASWLEPMVERLLAGQEP